MPRFERIALLLVLAAPARAQQGNGFWERWFERSDRAKEEQPHWITPVATVTPRLEQEFRYDVSRQVQPNGSTLNVGGGKGPELIPWGRAQVSVGLPAYQTHSQPGVRDGWGDFSLLTKYRLAAKNETEGNYILTAFLGASVPSGTNQNGAEHATITPTLAAGKGWGDFSLQSTLGAALPVEGVDRTGTPVLHNVAVQYRVRRRFWPELEVNTTLSPNGERAGKKQVFVTPGLVIGRIPLTGRLALAVGTGFQIAVTEFHTYNHKVIWTVRFPF